MLGQGWKGTCGVEEGRVGERRPFLIYNGPSRANGTEVSSNAFQSLGRTAGVLLGSCLLGLPWAKHVPVPSRHLPHPNPCGCLGPAESEAQIETVAATTWPGEAEGVPISLLRKWPHKSDRETHLWMLVKVLLLITSKVSEALGGSWESGVVRAWEQVTAASAWEAEPAPCAEVATLPRAPRSAPPGWGAALALSLLGKRKLSRSFPCLAGHHAESKPPLKHLTHPRPSFPGLLSCSGTLTLAWPVLTASQRALPLVCSLAL